MKSSSNTINALFRRGVPQSLAIKLSQDNYTVSGLKQLPIAELKMLGFTEALAIAIRKGSRPPVDGAVVSRLMHECRRTCCICRSRQRKSLVLHHTKEWSKHHSHDQEFLAVLCNDCHSEAHTYRELGRNLTGEEILENKVKWIRKVQEDDARVLLDGSSKPELLGIGPVWDYFNHRRIIEVVKRLKIDPTLLYSYTQLSSDAPINSSGEIDWALVNGQTSKDLWFLYYGALRNSDGVYAYFAELVTEIVAETSWVDIRSIWTKAQMRAVLKVSDIVVLTAGFRFRSNNTLNQKGPNQLRDAYYQKNGLRLKFRFDAWETTTSSSRGNLSGIWVSTVIGIVRAIEIDENRAEISLTCLAIGTGFDQSTQRTPDVAYAHAQEDDEDSM
jgi:hypothetical protein